MNAIPKIVFSTQPLEPLGETTGALKDATRINPTDRSEIDAAKIVAAWMSSPVAMGDLSLEISKLKSQPGKYILAHGGASFAQALVKTGQIDEYHLLNSSRSFRAGPSFIFGVTGADVSESSKFGKIRIGSDGSGLSPGLRPSALF